MNVSLSKRLLLIASFVPKGRIVADIGSDHALIPSYLAINEVSPCIIAGEVNEGPYQAAKKQITELNLEQNVAVRKGNGLTVLQDAEAQVIIIAGMGGSLIKEILENGKEKLTTVERLILQPNIGESNVREWLDNNGWMIITEEIMEEDNRMYEIIVAEVKSSNQIVENVYEKLPFSKQVIHQFGPILLEKGSEILKKKWRIELEKKRKILMQLNSRATIEEKDRKILAFKEEIKNIEEVLDWLEKGKISSKS